MSKVIEEVTEQNASLTLTDGGSTRWLAPEVIEGKSPNKEADIYSFAMAILELLSGRFPYADCRNDAQVVHNIFVLRGSPARPQNNAAELWLSDDLWDLMQKAWHKEASFRPSMSEMSIRIQEINRR